MVILIPMLLTQKSGDLLLKIGQYTILTIFGKYTEMDARNINLQFRSSFRVLVIIKKTFDEYNSTGTCLHCISRAMFGWKFKNPLVSFITSKVHYGDG